MRKIILTFFAFVFFNSFGQNLEEIKKLKTLKNDTTKAKILGNIAYDYGIKKPDSALYYYNESKKLSLKFNFYNQLIRCNNNITELYRQMGNYKKSLIYDLMNIELSKKHGTQIQLANSYENLSTTYHYLIKFDSCAKYDLQALKIYETLNANSELVGFYSNLAESYLERRLYKKSLEYGFKSLNLSKKGFGSQLALAYTLASISTSFLFLNDNQKALYYAEKALLLSKKEKIYYLEQVTLGNIILIKINQKKYTDLFKFTNQLNNLKSNINSLEYDANVMLYYGATYFYNDQEIKAKEYFLKTLAISEPNNFSVITKKPMVFLIK